MYKVFSSPALKDSNGILQKDLTGVSVKEVNLSLPLYLRVVRSMLWSVLSIVNFNVSTYTAFSSIQVTACRFSHRLNFANRTSVRSFTNKINCISFHSGIIEIQIIIIIIESVA